MCGLTVLLQFLHRLSAVGSVKQAQNDNFEHIFQYITAHIYEQIAMEDLAEMVGMSESRFKRKFKEENGLPPREYINREKVERGKALLKDTELSVTEISNRLGFSDSGYFAQVFRRFAGCTPNIYRKRQILEIIDFI